MDCHIILFLFCIGLAFLQLIGAKDLEGEIKYNMEIYRSEKNAEIANEHLDAAISKMLKAAKEKGKETVKGVWFIVHPQQASWITPLWKEGFRFHMAVNKSLQMAPEYTDVVVMKISFEEDPKKDTVPLPAFTTIGLAAIVLHTPGKSSLIEFLLKPKTGQEIAHKANAEYMLPGTNLKPGETIEEGIKRALEGVDNPEFHGILEIKHLPNEGQPIRAKADMMIYCIVTVQNKSDHKIYRWKHRNEIIEKMKGKKRGEGNTVEGSPGEKGEGNGKSMLSTGNWNAVLAVDGWYARWKKELQKNKELKLFFKDQNPENDPKKESSRTYAFYRTKNEWEKIIRLNH